MSQEITVKASDQDTLVTIEDPKVTLSTTDPGNLPPTLTAQASSPTLPDGKILLTATANDPDGNIVRILWTSLNAKAVINDPTKEDTFATTTTSGPYQFKIEIEDDKGYIVFMNVTSIVAAAPNTLPVVNAGQDLTIIAPASTAQLNGTGSDAEGGVSFAWSKLSGSGTIVNPTSAVANVTGLTVGVSVFRLTVTDSAGATKTDDVTVTVNSSTVPGTTFNLSFPQLTTDYTRPFAGFGEWINAYEATIPNVSKLDRYDRFGWGQLAASWLPLETKIKSAIDAGAKFGFGVMTCMSIAQSGWKETIRFSDGSAGMYPQSVHDEMQASALKDWKYQNTWIPNWNSPAYTGGLAKFYKDLYALLNNTTYKGIKYKDAINYIDIRSFGDFGEFHMWGIHGSEPTNARETEASLIAGIKAISDNIPDIWLCSLSDGLTHDNSYVTNNVSYLLLTGRNAKGKFGIRKDHMGSQYFPSEDAKYNSNTAVVNGQKLGDLFRDGWKEAPYTGEPALGNSNGYAYMDDDVSKYHFVEVGNGNYGGFTTSNIVAANKVMGYRIGIPTGTLTTNTGALGVTLNWSNTGITPTYEDWKVTFELRQGTTVVKSLTSVFTPTMMLPGGKAATDNFTGLPSGTYDLYLVIKNPSGYRNMPLNQTGNKSGYLLKSGVVL